MMRELVCRLMRVPDQPAPPPGQPPRIFRAAPNFLRLRLLGWCIGLSVLFFLAAGTSVGAVLALRSDMPRITAVLITAAAVAVVTLFVLELVIGLLIVKLDYEMRWYMVSDRAIRIREGIWVVKEKTIALANIQNISIRQGPLQRLLGISDVEVRTAGGGDERAEAQKGKIGDPLHVGYFRGVANAEEIRDVLQAAARKHTDTGLGDSDSPSAEPLEAAQLLLTETRAVRALLAQM